MSESLELPCVNVVNSGDRELLTVRIRNAVATLNAEAPGQSALIRLVSEAEYAAWKRAAE